MRDGATTLPRFSMARRAEGLELYFAIGEIFGRRLQRVVHLDRRLLEIHRRLSTMDGNRVRGSDAGRLGVRLNLRPAVHVDTPREANRRYGPRDDRKRDH